MRQANWLEEVSLLGTTQDLFRAECWNEVVHLGGTLRSALRDKKYSITDEFASLFLSESSTMTYALESHERVYLTLLMVISLLRLDEREDAKVELRRANDEMNAVIYNHGEDRLNSALMAALWEEFDAPELAAPYWRRVDFEPVSELHGAKADWKVYGVGEVGDYEWSLKADRKNVYRIRPKSSFPSACRSRTGLRVPATDWAEKNESSPRK